MGAAAAPVADALLGRSERRGRPIADFRRAAAREGWGPAWHFPHYERRRFIRRGRAFLELPAGLESTAPSQPTPAFLLDHSCAACDITSVFSVDNPTARPGVLFGAETSHDYHAVTVELDRLVLARYHRTGRDVLASAAVSPLTVGRDVSLDLEVRRSSVRARLRTGRVGEWQLRVASRLAAGGTPGVLLVHPTDLQPAALRLERFRVATDGAFRPTRPAALYLLSGIPRSSGDIVSSVALRAGSSFPALIRFEWAEHADWSGASGESGWLSAEHPPYTATCLADVPGAQLFWRARLRSPTSQRESISETHSVRLHAASKPLVMLAASCVEFGGMPPTDGFTRMLEAAVTRPAALVFQGDMGYANNKYHSCYLASADYFADRFTRFLADPRFSGLRKVVPVGFTIDDHDYGPRNNADRTTVQPWAITLWNRMHADPSATGYFDFRFGDVHCLTLDGRRYCDPISTPNRPSKTKLGRGQLAWMQSILETSDAELFVVFSADTFASRFLNPGSRLIPDCFVGGWPDEYARIMSLFGHVQASGKRVLVLSGDAHSLRVHYHPPGPDARPDATPVVEFVCSGLRPRRWFGAATGDPTLDPIRNVVGRAGGGMVTIDPPIWSRRTIVLRAIAGDAGGDSDLFPPLTLSFAPGAADAEA